MISSINIFMFSLFFFSTNCGWLIEMELIFVNQSLFNPAVLANVSINSINIFKDYFELFKMSPLFYCDCTVKSGPYTKVNGRNSPARVGCQSVDLFSVMNFYNAVSFACLFYLNFNKINFLFTSYLCKDVFS